MSEMSEPQVREGRKTALRFVILIGILSFFADFTYEGSRSILGPFLAVLQANAFIVGVVAGLGEFLGYGLRMVSGRVADRTQKFWPITIAGYVVQMASVPLLALAGNWQMAAVLIILERMGKATRNPPRDAMLAHAGSWMKGYGWAFGLHEALDQFGALFGPLAVAGVLALRGDYRLAFAALVVPAAINLCLVMTARLLYAHPEKMKQKPRMSRRGDCRAFSGSIWPAQPLSQPGLLIFRSLHITSQRRRRFHQMSSPFSTRWRWASAALAHWRSDGFSTVSGSVC